MLLDDDRTRLLHMLEAAGEARGYVASVTRDEFDAQRPLQHSVVRCIEIMGEAASRLSTEYRTSHDEVPWQDIVRMRNRLVHAYFDIDLDIVWRTGREELSVLVSLLETLVDRG